MTAKSPAFQCYSRDVQVRIAALSVEEKGAWLSLWLWSWTEGPLPTEPGRLARIAGVSMHRMRAMLPALLPLFEEQEGKLVSADLEQQRAEQKVRQAVKQKGAQRRWELERQKSSNGAKSPDAPALHVECSSSAPSSSTAGTSLPTTTSTASARVPDGGWGMAAGEILSRDDWWQGEPMPLRRQLLPAVMARRAAKDPSATVWGAIKYVLRQPRVGTEHAAAENGNGKSPEAPPLPPELLEPFQRFSALPKSDRERWTERGRRKAPGNLTGEDLERAIQVCTLREFATAERAPPGRAA